jgi:hypothetical protein
MVRSGGVSTGDRDDVCRAREVLLNLEAARMRLSIYDTNNDPWVLEEKERLERRIREITSWLRSIDRESRGSGPV